MPNAEAADNVDAEGNVVTPSAADGEDENFSEGSIVPGAENGAAKPLVVEGDVNVGYQAPEFSSGQGAPGLPFHEVAESGKSGWLFQSMAGRKICKILQIFSGFVLGCIKTKFCK